MSIVKAVHFERDDRWYVLELFDDASVRARWGRGGAKGADGGGAVRVTHFKTMEEAKEDLKARTQERLDSGYRKTKGKGGAAGGGGGGVRVGAKRFAPSSSSSSSSSSSTTTPGPKRSKKSRGPKLVGSPSVDPQSGIAGGSIEGNYDARLTLLDLSKNMDKWYVVQIIKDTSRGDYVLFKRWGRTGTMGQSMVERGSLPDMIKGFEDIFKAKSGHDFDATGTTPYPPLAGKYKVLKQSYKALSGRFEYYLDDGWKFGKQNGWHPYTPEASAYLEQIYRELLDNEGLDLGKRVVQSGDWAYLVDLEAMTQENTSTHRKRTIRRIK